tara:strand:+ start:344 stop:853 length:510 start_codon:yes stop_codon:yes gene_type:complete
MVWYTIFASILSIFVLVRLVTFSRRYFVSRKYFKFRTLKKEDLVFLEQLRKVTPKGYRILARVKFKDINKLAKLNFRTEENNELLKRFAVKKDYKVDFVVVDSSYKLKFVINLEHMEESDVPKLYNMHDMAEQLLRLLGLEVFDYDYADNYKLTEVKNKFKELRGKKIF